MIQPAGFRGAAFGDASDGNGRDDDRARRRISAVLGISNQWASVVQVHGPVVLDVDRPGRAGEGDGLITVRPGLPLTVATADCVPIIIEGDRSAAVVHAGWRGVAAGVIGAGLDAMEAIGDSARRAAIGPAIGPCCYEVGEEVLDAIAGFTSTTSFGTPSVDLWAAAEAQLAGLVIWRADRCTATDTDYWSYRRDGTSNRQIAVAWVPEN